MNLKTLDTGHKKGKKNPKAEARAAQLYRMCPFWPH